MGFLTEYREVNRLLNDKQQLVFYAETRHHFQYFERLVHDLLKNESIRITYITSDPKDPLLLSAPPRMKVYKVKWLLGFLFSRLKAAIMVMTMPDLDNFLFRRSKETLSYIYLFHAAVSTHQQYRKKAFYHYDAIYCTGPYQELELRTVEMKYGLQKKDLVPYGYPLLDQVRSFAMQKGAIGKRPPRILIAPSWFDGCIFDTCLGELIKQLSSLPYDVVLRSHPEYEKRRKTEFAGIRKLVKQYPNFSFDETTEVMQSLGTADILITDRSGIAFEYAFGVRRPVLFIDTVLKENNPDWNELGLPPVENSLRNQLGLSLSPVDLTLIPGKIKELEELLPGFSSRIEMLEKQVFYNSEESYNKGAEYILGRLKEN